MSTCVVLLFTNDESVDEFVAGLRETGYISPWSGETPFTRYGATVVGVERLTITPSFSSVTENTAPDAHGPACRYCGADCSNGRSWDGGDLYACSTCSDKRAAANLVAKNQR